MNKKLALVIHSLSSGGAERVAVNLANHWAADGRDVTIITIAGRDSDFYQPTPRVSRVALDLGYASGSVPAAILANWRRVRRLRAALQALKPDVVIAFMPTANILLTLASIGAPWKRIGSEHTFPTKAPIGRSWEFLRRRLYGRLDVVTTLTPAIAAWMGENTTARRVSVIPNAVWPIPGQEPTIEPNEIVPPDANVLLAAGRLEPEKGFDLLLQAVSTLAEAYSDWHVVVLGEGGRRRSLESLIDRLDLRHRVSMPGLVGNIQAWYRRADLYVMSSRFEGFGNTLAEALACGTPAVSFDCVTGPGEILEHEISGLLVPPEDVDGLANALAQLMGDRELRERYAAAAERARTRFSVSVIARQWEALFEC